MRGPWEGLRRHYRRRLAWGLILLPVVAAVALWTSDDRADLNPPTVALLVVWEIAAVMLARRLRVWPFGSE